MIATAPGKLILTGEYAVLDGAQALVVAVDRRVVAKRHVGPRGTSPFLVALADELAKRFGDAHPAARAALEIVVDSSPFFEGDQKLGLGSSAAVTVAATTLALAAEHAQVPVIDRALVQAIAMAVHARGQIARHTKRPTGEFPAVQANARGSDRDIIPTRTALATPPHGVAVGATRGSGADIAAAVHGGTIAFAAGKVDRLPWPARVRLVPFFTGMSADTASLVSQVATARTRYPEVGAALAAIAEASRAACQACAVREDEIASNALMIALQRAGAATDQLAQATGVPLVPACVAKARAALASLGGTAKTTGAGGGDVAVGIIPSTADLGAAKQRIADAGGTLLDLAIDPDGVDLAP